MAFPDHCATVDVMEAREKFLNRIVAAFLSLFLLCLPVGQAAMAQDASVEALLDQLIGADKDEAFRIEQDIWRMWSRSGSPAMDLLLERGRAAAESGDYEAAIDHLTALTDHAPGFAEGWNARATVFFQTGDFGPAVADIKQVLALNPRHFGALAGFGMILEALERKTQALEVYRAALAIHPNMQGVLDSVKRLETDIAGREL